MPKLTINGQELEVAAGTNLIEAAQQLGTEIPHFCYHPGLSVAGNCRMCLVEIEKSPKLQIACNTAVAEGMVVMTDSDKVKKARAGVMEFLLLNHPIDCPICDCAGECYLQDYYMDHDLKASRLEGEKNKKQKAQDIGPHVMLDKERCVLCSRCVRFTDEVSETHELGIFGRGSTEEIGLYPGTQLDNAYSGCVVDLCPVGALTDKDFRFKSRPWFLKETATVCSGCSLGCNVVLNTNTNPYNKVGQARAYRYFPRENKSVNDYWMCDEGRYSFHAIDDNRVKEPLAAGAPLTLADAVNQAAEALKAGLAKGPEQVAFLLSPQMTNEELYAFKWLAQQLGVTQVEVGDDLKAMGASDDYLIQADKNPNSRGAADLGLGPRAGVLGGKAVIDAAKAGKLSVLLLAGHDLGADAAAVSAKATVIGIHSHAHAGALASTLLLPKAVHAEQDGSFTNVKGRVQRVRKALEPLAESLPGYTLAFHLADSLGHKAPAAGPAELFALLAAQVPAYAGLSLDGLGDQGSPTGDAAKVGA